jgi:thiol:disulfide interchange protein DsbD
VGLGLGRADLAQWIATEWWVNAIFALLFIVFGLSLLGLFEIRLPAFLNDVAAKASGTGGYLSVFGMGMTLVVTSFTCTAPFVGTLLVWAGQGGSTLKVVYAMGVFGLTMAVPFVLLARSPDAIRKIPRSGEWMNQLKVTMGILELGLALKFVSNIDLAANTFLIGRRLFLVLWGLSFLAAALYLLGAFGGVSRGLTRGRALGAGFLLAFAAYLGWGLTGRPLGKYLEAFFPNFEGLYDRAFAAVVVDDYEAGLRLARERNLPIFLHFTGFQ